ncbi:MAG: DUF6049 family protein [Aeromicrobium sp.]
MSSPRRTILVALLVTILGSLLVPASPGAAADDEPDLRVSIRSLDPSYLTVGTDVTLTGTVTNRDDHAWTTMQAYLVIPTTPFTTRAQIDEAVDNGDAYTGSRVVAPGSFDEIGDLAPGQTARFRITVPYEQLGITGDEGVYPVGVQILATDDEGSRSQDAVGRATTFLPLIASTQDAVPTSIVWPFLMPDHRGPDGDYADPEALLTSVSAGGQLRNLLDLAGSTVPEAATIVVDPALLVGVDDLAEGRRQPDDLELTDAQAAEAQRFLDDLLGLARTRASWILDYDRPDDLALSDNPDLRADLQDAIDMATDAALTTYQLTGRRVSWPTRGGVSRRLLADLRGDGDSPVIVNPASVPDWEPRLGSVVKYESTDGPVPLLVEDLTAGTTPGVESVATLRQRLLSEAALAVLERTIDPESRADSVVMVDPVWDPGARWATGRLSDAFVTPFTRPASLESVLRTGVSEYDGAVPRTAKARPLSRTQLEAATGIVTKGQMLSSITSKSDELNVSLARDIAGVLGVRWRLDRPEGYSIAVARERSTAEELDKISIEGPPSVTLSSSKGGFPLTIRNDTDEAIRIGVGLASSNPALSFPSVDPVEVGAGERRTLTVQVDLGTQRTTFMTARLMTDEGQTIGSTSTFKVRSSSIGAVLWVAMGLAGLFVLVTLARRFHRRRTGASSDRPADDDD